MSGASGNSGPGSSPPNLNYMDGTKTAEEDIRALVSERFTYKAWTPEQIAAGKGVTGAAIDFGVAIVKNVPPSATRTRALNLIEEARMLANAAITHGGKF